MRISSTGAIEGGRVLYAIGRIEAASTWHPAHGSPLQENWRELVLRELMRKAEDIDADAIIRVDYQNDGVIRIDETGVNLKRVVATGIAVKLSRAARFGLSGIVAARHAETSPDLTRAHRCAARRSSVLQNPGTLPCGHGSLRNGALLRAKADRVGA